jgi:hypothetical protein
MHILLVSLFTTFYGGQFLSATKLVPPISLPKGALTLPYDVRRDTIKDYLHIPGPIEFDGASYRLAWTAHPTNNFYKQEYVPKRSKVENYHKMVFVDVAVDTANLWNVVREKLVQLELRKRKDSVVNYKLFQNTDSTEYMLDFVISEGEPLLTVVEWNIYRYKTFVDSSGHKGYMLFANSLRAYGDEIIGFFADLSATRKRILPMLIKYELPVVNIID